MDWTLILEQFFKLVIFPVLSIAGMYLIILISTKINEIKQNTKNENTKKYLDMLNETISATVLATTQTYVETLKKEGKFDLEAQKKAFQQPYDAVMNILTDEAKKYITEAIGDLNTYVTNRIEAEVNMNKGM